MRVLFIGGTGTISRAVSNLAVEKDIDLWLFNRGNHNLGMNKKVKRIIADIHNEEQMKEKLDGQMFDVIVSWISFTVDDVKRDYRLFKGHTKQYIFISSASAYMKPIPSLPVTEDTPLGNEFWQYSKNKQLCEEYLMSVHSDDFNVTIVRPSHTYNDESLIFTLKSRTKPYTMLQRILNEERVIVLDQGMTFWTLTYNLDFAYGFLDLLGNEETYGEAYHLTSDKIYSWERIYEMICEAAGKPVRPIYIPTEYVLKHFPEFEAELIGDKLNDFILDNSKVKDVAPNYTSETDYGDIAKLAVERLMYNPKLQEVDEEFLRRYEKCIDDFKAQNVKNN